MGSNRPSPLGGTDTTVIKVAIPDEMATVLTTIGVAGLETRSGLVARIVSDWLHEHEHLWLPPSLIGCVEWRAVSDGKRPAVIGGPLFSEMFGQVRVWSIPEMRRIARMFDLSDTQVADVMLALGFPQTEWPTGPNRKAIPNGVRYVVVTRSRGQCESGTTVNGACSRPATTMHHIVHRVDGGLNVPVNLQHLCKQCHQNEHRDDTPTEQQKLSAKAELRRLKKRLAEPTAPVVEYWRVYDRKGGVVGEYPSEEAAEMAKPHNGRVQQVIL